MHFPPQKCLKKICNSRWQFRGISGKFLIEGVQTLVQRGLLNLWQITSPPHPLPPGAKFNARFIKKLSQLKSDIRSLHGGGGGGGWGIGSATAILATKRSRERQMYRVYWIVTSFREIFRLCLLIFLMRFWNNFLELTCSLVLTQLQEWNTWESRELFIGTSSQGILCEWEKKMEG